MRGLALVLTLAGTALPCVAARRVTVEQLEKALARTEARSDAEVARQLADLELTERLSHSRMTQLEAGMPGEKSRQALLVLADTSAFLDPPAAEIPGTATPDAAAQKRMMALTVDYLGKSLPMLPNLFATRETSRFESRAEGAEGANPNALRSSGHSAVTVLYRDNQEFADLSAAKGEKRSPEVGLSTWGEFGPILGTVIIDAARSKLEWSHWELGATGAEAVFRYEVPREKSHYDVRFCCVSSSYGLETNEIRQRSGYHGEIMVDPDDGAILRLTVEAELEPGNPISQAQIAVEYAPVEIGGKSYVAPSRGIALARAPDAKALHNLLYPAGSDQGLPPLQKASPPATPASAGPQQTLLNDITFRGYHMLRAEARVMAGDAKPEVSASTVPPLSGAGPVEVPPAPDAAQPASELATANASPPPASAAAEPAPPIAAPAAEAVVPEVSVAAATGLPESPAIQQATASGTGFTLRITSKLVDVNLVALDKKGRPITNLKPEELEIYDNGVKQDIRTFSQAEGGPAPAVAQAAAAAPAEPMITNHPASPVKTGGGETNTIVLLMDGANLPFNDFANAREQSVRFLKTLPDNQPVALYAMKKYGFEVLIDETPDHERVAARLAKWNPTAADLSEAQFNEERNRQSFDTVRNLEDLLSVNGSQTAMDSASQQEALDAKLRPLGSDPAKSVLGVLVDVGRHLGAFPGHKSLVWVTSDNALADWNNASTTIEKTSKFVEPAALRVQEAMNNAHVSVYPLDASTLEGNAVDASKYGRNVELSPTFMTMPNGAAPGGLGPEATAGATPIDINQAQNLHRDLTTNRLYAQMQQDMRPIQGVFREIAAATGGQALRRSNNIVGQLSGVAAEGRATYLLGFSPSQAADGQYHLLTVKLVGRKDATLRYRSGYQYDKDPSTVKDRFAKVVWEPIDASDITMRATPSTAGGSTLKLNIAATDLAMAQTGEFWTDKIGIFVVRRDDARQKAQITGQTLNLRLKPETYQKMMREGIPFDQIVEQSKITGTVRIVVIDENSGRMGSITVPAGALLAKNEGDGAKP